MQILDLKRCGALLCQNKLKRKERFIVYLKENHLSLPSNYLSFIEREKTKLNAIICRAQLEQDTPTKPNFAFFFIFIFLENIFYRNIFSISQFTVLYPCRPAGGRQGLICKLKKIICAEALGGSLPPPCRAAGPWPGKGAAGSPAKLQYPLAVFQIWIKIKTVPISCVLDMDKDKNHQ